MIFADVVIRIVSAMSEYVSADTGDHYSVVQWLYYWSRTEESQVQDPTHFWMSHSVLV